MTNREDLAKKIQSAVFPGVQGSAHLQVIAGKAVALGDALTDEFKTYARNVQSNARILASSLQERQVRIVSGGTDTHLVLVDVSSKGLSGQQAQDLLGRAGITTNKNPIPFDSAKPSEWKGIRLGSAAGTTRGFGGTEFAEIANLIGDLFEVANEDEKRREDVISKVGKRVQQLCDQFPTYA